MDFIKETDRCITNVVSSTFTEKNVISKQQPHANDMLVCCERARHRAICLHCCAHAVDRGCSLLRAKHAGNLAD